MRASHAMCYLLALVAWFAVDGPLHSMQQKEAPPEDQATQIFALKHVDAETAMQIYGALYDGDVKLKVEPKSNSLVFRGTKSQLDSLVRLLEELEDRASKASQSAPANVITWSFELKTGGPTVAELREQYRTLDQQCLDLAKRLRSNQDTTPANRKSLTEMVERAFRLRQDLQRAEVAENARRLQTIKQTIESREGLKSQIVQRRVDELLNPNVDWSKSDLVENTKTVGEKKTDSEPWLQANRPQIDSSLPTGPAAPSLGLPIPSSLVGTSELLRSSPAQMRSILEGYKSTLNIGTKECDRIRARIQKGGHTDGEMKALRDELEKAEAALKSYQRDFQFAKLQYDEAIKYLEVAWRSAMEQMNMAEEDYSRKAQMYSKGSASQSEVNAVSVRRRELKVELQRVESLLTLYHAAGDIPELNEALKPSGSKLGLNISDAKLGVPKWLDGNGGLTTSPGGYAIVSNDKVGLVAQILFAEIPDHKGARLVLKVETPVSVSSALKSRGVAETDWVTVREVLISDAEIQAAIDGKPFRRSYFLKSDGSLVEKDTGSEAANSEKDPLVATIELAAP